MCLRSRRFEPLRKTNVGCKWPNCVSQASIPSDQEQHEAPPYQSHSSNAPTAPKTLRQHVLLVEDNLINQKIVYRKLKSKGYSVTTANDGKEAAELIVGAPKPSTGDKSAFDICLMDMEMPRMDGNTATKTIRELERQDQIEYIPILGVTANVRSGQQSEM
jgi:CheY-like chemotaxis protein